MVEKKKAPEEIVQPGMLAILIDPPDKSVESWSLRKRLLAMQLRMHVTKDGTADPKLGGYKFHRIDDVETAIQRLAVEYGVTMFFDTTDCTLSVVKDRKGNDQFSCLLEGDYHFQCEIPGGDSDKTAGQSLAVHGYGQGLDYGDKATGKAVSYAIKNILIPFFHLKGGVDNESFGNEIGGGAEREYDPSKTHMKPKQSAPPKDSPADGSLIIWWPKAHKDKPISSVPISYLNWCIKNFDKPDDKSKVDAVNAEIARRQGGPNESVEEDPYHVDPGTSSAPPIDDDDIPF